MGLVSEVITEIGQTAVIVAGASWFAKSIVTNWINKNIESHKADLNKSIEQYKLNLQQELQLHQIRNSKLHTDRSEIIMELFKCVTSLGIGLTLYRRKQLEMSIDDRIEEVKSLESDVLEFTNYYEKHSVYFNEEIRVSIETLIYHYILIIKQLKEDPTNDIKENNEILRKIKDLKNELQRNFSQLLGV